MIAFVTRIVSVAEQDEGLDELSKVISRQKQIAQTIHSEVDHQNGECTFEAKFVKSKQFALFFFCACFRNIGRLGRSHGSHRCSNGGRDSSSGNHQQKRQHFLPLGCNTLALWQHSHSEFGLIKIYSIISKIQSTAVYLCTTFRKIPKTLFILYTSQFK